MATNFEHYKEEILEILRTGSIFAKANEKIYPCVKIGCDICDFRKSGDNTNNCIIRRFEWVTEEYKPQPKLTKKERLFCELVETGWIARDNNKNLYLYKEKPKKGKACWNDLKIFTLISIFAVDFPFIQWQDTEPWAVEDLLKLEVEE